MFDYRLIFKAHGHSAEAVCFSDSSATRALILVQDRQGPAELWAGDDYVTTLWQSPESGFWMLFREPDVVARCNEGRRAKTAPQRLMQRPFESPPKFVGGGVIPARTRGYEGAVVAK